MNNEIKIGILVLIIIVLLIIVIRNSMVVKIKKIERNKALVDVFLKKRYDLIPNLVEVCKGYSNFEKETLEHIIKLRSDFNANPTNDNEHLLNSEYKNLLAHIESYPNLKANETYLNLQKEMSSVENELQASRRIYINSVTSYNNLVMMFPCSIIAKLFNFKQMDLPSFSYDNIKIDF